MAIAGAVVAAAGAAAAVAAAAIVAAVVEVLTAAAVRVAAAAIKVAVAISVGVATVVLGQAGIGPAIMPHPAAVMARGVGTLVCGIVTAGVIVAAFAFRMGTFLPGRAHEVIRILHFLIGLGAIGLAESIGVRIRRGVAK